MGTYVVNSKKEQQELLTRCGLNSFVDLYKDIPEMFCKRYLIKSIS